MARAAQLQCHRVVATLTVLLVCGFLTARAATLAVSNFDNNSADADLDPLGKGLADMVITDLASIESVTVVEREKLQELLAEIQLGESAYLDPRTAQRLGRGLGSELVLTGSFTIQGATLRIDTRLIDVETGTILLGESVTGEKDEFFALEKELVGLVVRALDLTLDQREQMKVNQIQTSSYEAFVQFSRGLDGLDRGDLPSATVAMNTAVFHDPEFARAREILDLLEQSQLVMADDSFIAKNETALYFKRVLSGQFFTAPSSYFEGTPHDSYYQSSSAVTFQRLLGTDPDAAMAYLWDQGCVDELVSFKIAYPDVVVKKGSTPNDPIRCTAEKRTGYGEAITNWSQKRLVWHSGDAFQNLFLGMKADSEIVKIFLDAGDLESAQALVRVFQLAPGLDEQWARELLFQRGFKEPIDWKFFKPSAWRDAKSTITSRRAYLRLLECRLLVLDGQYDSATKLAISTTRELRDMNSGIREPFLDLIADLGRLLREGHVPEYIDRDRRRLNAAQRRRAGLSPSLLGPRLDPRSLIALQQSTTTDESNPVARALAMNQEDLRILSLLKSEPDPGNIICDTGDSILISAVKKRRTEIVNALLSVGADPKIKGTDGQTPLAHASLRGQIQMVKSLLAFGAPVDQAGASGVTALHLAVASEHVDIARVLIDAGADPQAQAAFSVVESLEFRKWIAGAGIDPKTVRLGGGSPSDLVTPRSLAAQAENGELAKLLGGPESME